MLRLYNTLAFPLRGVAALWSVFGSRTPDGATEWAERRAKALPVADRGGVWLHGASVGEVRLIALLARVLRAQRPGLPVAVSCQTPTGRGQLPSPPEVDAAFFVPLDFAGYPGRVLDALRPAALVLVETELWPNLMSEAADLGVATAIVNARLSTARMRRYRRWRGLYGPVLRRVSSIGAQSAAEADRFVELGARKEIVTVTGSIKYDLPAPAIDVRRLRARFGLAGDRPVVVAGSTGAGEDPLVLDAFVRARRAREELYLVIAPRHPERASEVAREAAERGLELHRLSAGSDTSAAAADGLLVDTVGELATLYGLGRVAFVGGSLVPIGGHNLLEPAAAGVPVIFGPHTHHFEEPAEALVRAGGGFRVYDTADLARLWIELVEDDARRAEAARRAGEVILENRGALERSVALVLALLEESRPTVAGGHR